MAGWGRGYVAIAVEGVETRSGGNWFGYAAKQLAGPENLSASRIGVAEWQPASF